MKNKSSVVKMVAFLLLGGLSLAKNVVAADDRYPVVCMRLEANEKTEAPVVPEGALKKIFHSMLQKEGIQTVNSCDFYGMGYNTDGRMEIIVDVAPKGAEKSALLEATMKFVYFKLTADGRNEKVWQATSAIEKATEDDVRQSLKTEMGEKIREFLKAAKPIESSKKIGA